MTRLVIIDPGHGGKDPGATGEIVTEKYCNLLIAKLTSFYLQQYDIASILTRQIDETLKLCHRVPKFIHLVPDAFVSIHFNSNEGTPGTGFEIWTYDKDYHGLALKIEDTMDRQLVNHKNRGVKYSKKYRITKDCHRFSLPHALIEVAFINNKKDMLYVKENFKNICRNIANGIYCYLN